MVADGLRMLETIFAAVVDWFSQLMDSIGGRVYVVAGFMILLVCSLLLAPIRGSAMRDIGGGVSDFTKNTIHSNKSKSKEKQ